MPKPEWGTKRVCPTTGKRFYDLNNNPIVSPYTGEVVPLDTGKSRPLIAQKAKPEPANDGEEVVLDDNDSGNEVDLGDEVLEDDEGSENVSLEDLTEVEPEDDES